MTKHYSIPVFIPELACPFRCVFCNQRKISGHISIPGTEEVIKIVNSHLVSFKKTDRWVDVAFFGGNFTGIPRFEQEAYLRVVQPFLASGEIQGIRLSTRPDYINKEVLDLLEKYQVSTIELGAQSFDDKVLERSHRGHTASQTEKAAKAIHERGFQLGLQMMIGLPGDSLESSLYTARSIVDLGATSTRIYPTVVIKETALHQWYLKGEYFPLTLEEAVRWTTKIIPVFEAGNVQVIRTGLHPSEGLVRGKDLIAGPYHPQFRELVLSEIWLNNLLNAIEGLKENDVEFIIPQGQLNYAIGHKALNRHKLLDYCKTLKFTENATLKGREFEIQVIA
ncbi:MAG: radical SAM protein [Bacteroidales bacterium]|jgi:histone acetyltransferase (RNA polymerase elongator complex component)